MAIIKVYSELQSGRMPAAKMASKNGRQEEWQRHDKGHFFKPKFLVVIRQPDSAFVLGYN